MSNDATKSELMPYVEQWGMLFEALGATRMMGRVMGWLLVCEPPDQTARQIADAIGASISSVSTATRALARSAFIERVGVHGDRSVHFRVKPGMWTQLINARMQHFGMMCELAEEGLGLLPDSDTRNTARLREIESCCSFMERELPSLLARWEKEWKGEKS
jgi:hypothetical protein